MSDDNVGDRCTTGHHATESRGRRDDVPPSEAVRQFARENAPSKADLQRWFNPPDAPPFDAHLQFFQDLITLASSSPLSPLSPSQAQTMKQRWGFDAPYILDPATGRNAFLGLQLILTVACFVPPVSAFATGMLLVMGTIRGESGLSLAAGALPLGRLKQAERVIKALVKLGRVFKPTSIREYQRVAAQLLSRDRNLAQNVMTQLEQITSAREQQAVRMAMDAYNAEKQATGNLQRAARAAGDAFHKTMRAAGPGEGADRVLKSTKQLIEIKTHYVPIVDDLVLRKGSTQVLGYVLKEAAERSIWYKGRVLHVFIDPVGKQARRLVVDAMEEEKLLEALLRLSRK